MVDEQQWHNPVRVARVRTYDTPKTHYIETNKRMVRVSDYFETLVKNILFDARWREELDDYYRETCANIEAQLARMAERAGKTENELTPEERSAAILAGAYGGDEAAFDLCMAERELPEEERRRAFLLRVLAQQEARASVALDHDDYGGTYCVESDDE